MADEARFETVATTRSTNDDVAARARDGAAEGLWLRAGQQSGGRGRQGRSWESPAGNLYASTLVRLRPADPPAPTLALVAAIALHEAASQYAEGIEIKWPNDLVADGHKLAGILLEREGDAVVIGFGANLAHHPQLVDRAATSLAVLAGAAPDADAFLRLLAERFERRLGEWRSRGLEWICRKWLAAAHPIGTALATGEGVGLFDGLDETGALRLRLSDGDIRTIRAGDVFLV